MKQQNFKDLSDQCETLHAQTVPVSEAFTLNDLPVNEAQQVGVKGGMVTVEYLLLGPFGHPPAGTITSRP